MKKLIQLGAAAIVSTALATPLMAQEATQEPGMIGFNYPNSNYLTGGYGVRLPPNSGRYPRMFYAPRVYVEGPVGLPAAVVGGAIAVAPFGGYGPYVYYSDEPGYW